MNADSKLLSSFIFPPPSYFHFPSNANRYTHCKKNEMNNVKDENAIDIFNRIIIEWKICFSLLLAFVLAKSMEILSSRSNANFNYHFYYYFIVHRFNYFFIYAAAVMLLNVQIYFYNSSCLH
jgi:hypothetical protein